MFFQDLNLNNPLVNAIEEIGYIYPTPIQKEAFPVIMSGKDVVGIAQTGTGKTIAYLLPILRQLRYNKDNHPRVLILVPTRELVIQVVAEAKKLSQFMSVRVGAVYGGANINVQAKMVHAGLDIVVATPGRLIDFILGRQLKTKNINKLVIDEVDEMLNLGFQHQITSILDQLPEKRQNIMFSATLTDKVESMINDYFNFPTKIQIVPTGTPLEKIEQSSYLVPNFYTKVNLLAHLLNQKEEFKKVLVFVRSKTLADRIQDNIKGQFPNEVEVIHSNKTQNYRINAVNRFEDGTFRVLIATDIISRGIDISDISHVINFDTPDIPENYIHRIGRTGRIDSVGSSITFVNNPELEYIEAIQNFMKKPIPVLDFPKEVEVSDIYLDDEKIDLANKIYRKDPNLKKSQGAFQEKKEKNKKVNLGGSYKRAIALKYKNPKTRGDKRQNKK